MSEPSKKILFISVQDFANVSTRISQAINKHLKDWEAKVFCSKPHPFLYDSMHDFDCDVMDGKIKKEMSEWAKDVDIVMWAEEWAPETYYSYYNPQKTFLNAILLNNDHLKDRNTTKWVIFHIDIEYRNKPHYYNFFNPGNFDMQLLSPDLYRLADKTDILPTYPLFGAPFDVNFEEVYKLWDHRDSLSEIVICHSPSNALKGTEKIRQAAENLVRSMNGKVKYVEIGGPFGTPNHKSWKEIVEERGKYHIYIDQFNSDIGGIGMSSFEAMSVGMVTLCTTQSIPDDLWRCEGIILESMPLIRLPDSRDSTAVQNLFMILFGLCNIDRSSLREIGIRSAEWVEKHFSTVPFIERYREKVLDKLVFA